MVNLISWGKRVLYTLSPWLLVGCCYYSSQTTLWQNSRIHACPGFRSAFLQNVPCNQFRDIRFEIIKTECGYQYYISVFCIPLIPSCSYPASIKAHFSWNDGEVNSDLEVLQGGQKVLLPEELANVLIENLLNGSDITVKLGRYSSIIPAEGFSEAYSKLLQD